MATVTSNVLKSLTRQEPKEEWYPTVQLRWRAKTKRPVLEQRYKLLGTTRYKWVPIQKATDDD